MQFVDDGLGRHTNGANKKRRLLFNDDIDQLREMASGIIILAILKFQSQNQSKISKHTLVLRAFPPTAGINRSTPKGAFLSFNPFLISLICGPQLTSNLSLEGRCFDNPPACEAVLGYIQVPRSHRAHPR